ncbi:hypothetical protein [Aquimarina sp. I32.4]|uniref:hypothetical protein n=1 Tax=Aquimarina sp. I32.4 TaxID=2053903 RepID=UPI000CDE8540|nr:hypothetical protein [Aquimarina sp. I32.4]
MIKFFSIISIVGLLFNGCSDGKSNKSNSRSSEVESAHVLAYRMETPEGRIYYMEVHEKIPSKSNVSEAVELGLNNRIYSYNEHPYTWSRDDATITKWSVDKATLEVSKNGVISFAHLGISGDVAPPVFLSDTQAFFSKLAEGVIVEWNPSNMKITKVHNVDPLPDVGVQIDWYKDWFKYLLSNGKILMSIEFGTPVFCCSEYVKPGAMVAIFDPTTSSIEYSKDNRLYSNGLDILSDEKGTKYLTPGRRNAFVAPYFKENDVPNPFALLKLNDDGTFDSDFYVDLSNVLPITFYASSTFMLDNKLVFTYVDAKEYNHPDSYDQRWSVYGGGDFKTVVLDLETLKVTPFTGLDEDYDYTQFNNTIDGAKYFFAGYTDSALDTEFSFFLRQDGFDDFKVVSSHKGGTMQHIAKLW